MLLAGFCAMLMLILSASASAANITSAQSGNWETGATWVGGVPPGAGDNVTIASSHLVAVPVDAAAASIIVAANTSGTNGISIAAGTQLTVGGAISLTAPTAGTSTIAVGAGILNAASIAIPGSATAGRNCAVTVSSGTVTVTGSISFTGTAAQAQFVFTDAGTLNVGGNFESGGTLTTSGNGTINFNGTTAQTIGTYTTYNNVTASNSGSLTLTGATTFGGTLTVNSGTFTVGAYALTVSGATEINSTLSITSATGAKAFSGDVTVNSGGNWNNTLGNAAVSVGGNLLNNGTFGAGTGVHTFTGAGKTIGGVNAVSIPSLTVSGTLTNTGTLTVGTALAGAGTLTNDINATLNLGGTATITTLTATADPNTVNYTGAAQTLKATSYHHLGLSGSGTKTLTNVGTINGNLSTSGTCAATTAIATTIGGNLTVGTGTTLTVAGFNFTVTGTTSVSGTHAHSSATGTKIHVGSVTINSGGVWTNTGNSAFTFRNGLTFNGTTFTSGTGVYTFDTNPQSVEGAGTLSISSVTVTGITLTNNRAAFSVATALSGTGELLQGVGATLNIGGTSGITTLTATASPNTVNYYGAAQTVKAVTYHHLTLSGSSTKTITNVGTINGNLTFSGTCSATTTIAMAIGGNLVVGSGTTFTVAGFIFGVTGTTSVSGTLAHSSATGAKTHAGLVTINSGGSWTNAGNSAFTFLGGLTHYGATFSSGTGVYTFNTNPQTLDGGSVLTINNVTVDGITLTNNLTNFTVATALSGTGVLFQGTAATLNLGGTIGISTVTADIYPNTVNYCGAAQTVRDIAYHHLTLSGSGVKTMPASPLTVAGDFTVSGSASVIAVAPISTAAGFTIGSSASFVAGSFTHDIKGGFTNNNSFDATGSTFTFTGAADQLIAGTAGTTFDNLVINKPGGVVNATSSFNVNGVLTLGGGNIVTGANVVVITASGNVSRTSGHVIGNLRKAISAASPSQTFEIGDQDGYCPLSVVFNGVSTDGDLTAGVMAGEHPNIVSSTIDSVRDVNEYWTLTNGGIIFTNYDAIFTFAAGDVDGGVYIDSFKVGRYSGSVWTYPAVGVLTAGSTEATALVAFGDFVVGEDRPYYPVLVAIDPQTVLEGDSLIFGISATDADGDSLILSALDLPAHATLVDSGNGAGYLDFRPDFTQAGVCTVTIVATDGALADSELVVITVVDVDQVPSLVPVDSQSVIEGDTLSITVTATDAGGDSLILSAVDVPLNATFSDSGNGTGILLFYPSFTQAGEYTVTFIASDGTLADSEQVVINVINLDSVTISGNAGIAGATLTYTDGSLKTATADGSGLYAFNVVFDWSGTVTPSRTGYAFVPTSRSYTNLSSNQTDQDYAASLLLDAEQDSRDLVPGEYSLAQNYPNPFNPTTIIEYGLPRRSHVTIDVLNTLGQSVRLLVDGELPAGTHIVIWDGTDAAGQAVSSGVYLYRISARDFLQTRKMVLLK